MLSSMLARPQRGCFALLELRGAAGSRRVARPAVGAQGGLPALLWVRRAGVGALGPNPTLRVDFTHGANRRDPREGKSDRASTD